MRRSKLMIAKSVKKPKGRRSKLSADEIILIPDWPSFKVKSKEYDMKYHWAMIYANNFLTAANLKEEVITYLKNDESYSKSLKNVADWRFLNAGKRAWIINNGGELKQETLNWLKPKLDVLLLSAKTVGKEIKEKKKKETKKYTPTIQDRIKEKFESISAEMENFIDVESYDIDVLSWLKTKNVSVLHAKQLGTYYNPLLSELNDTIKKTDPQLVEAYSSFTKKEIKQLKDFIKNIISTCEAFGTEKKALKSPRKKKPKSVEKLISSMNYKTIDDEYKIASISPEKIIGAESLWTFNTKTRILTYFKSSDINGLNIKGTTIQNWDKKESTSKRVRKPELILPNITKGGKKAMKNLMKNLTTKDSKTTGRVNKDMILLKFSK